MLRKIASLVMLVFSAPAFAGGITIGAQSASPAVNASKTYTVSDADMARFYAYVQSAYPTIPCSPQPCTPAAATRVQSLQMWADGIIAGTVANVKSYETNNAVTSAASGVSPITAQ